MESNGDWLVTNEKKKKSANTKAELLRAAHDALIEYGFSGLSTRRVAEVVGAPMSQIQYHFGSKEGMILALFEEMNARLIARQKDLFENPELSISEQWDQACAFLDEDLNSGYVRILQELVAAGWSNPVICEAVKGGLDGWQKLLTQAAERADSEFGPFGPFTAQEIASLVSVGFLGAESQILLGRERPEMPIRQALKKVGSLMRTLETVHRGGKG
jgi:AcrR family transcriptional regulator